MKSRGLHPLAWICWVAAIGFSLSATRNPLYLGLILLCITLTIALIGLPPKMVRLMGGLLCASMLFNGLSVHRGQTILFSIPATMPIIAGPITAEALCYGMLTGWALAGIVVVLRLAQSQIPTRALLDLLPSAFAPIAVTITIAVAFIPTTLRQLRQIYEAQAIRGHKLRGLRDWLAVLMPLLIGGLDRALQLAEALAARGFPALPAIERALVGPAIAIGLALGMAGLLAAAWGFGDLSWGIGASGILLVGMALFLSSTYTPTTRYRRYRWHWRDAMVIIPALITVLLLILPLPGIDRQSLLYTPYPQLTLPLFQPVIGIATLGLAGMGIALLFEDQL